MLVVRLLSQDSTNDRFPKVCAPGPVLFLARLLPGLKENGRRGSLTVLCFVCVLCVRWRFRLRVDPPLVNRSEFGFHMAVHQTSAPIKLTIDEEQQNPKVWSDGPALASQTNVKCSSSTTGTPK